MEIFLRPITKNDTDLIVKWRNSKTVSSHCMNKNPITQESHMDFFDKYVANGLYQQFIVERIEETIGVASYPIATVYLKDIDRVNRRCELCIFTSDDEEWNTESQAIAIRMLLKKAFVELNMHKVYSYVFYKFIDEAELLKRAGFTSEAVLKNEAVDENGNFEDIVRFSTLNEE
jgi:RimJ/RimL family protein N-acetyltransferase